MLWINAFVVLVYASYAFGDNAKIPITGGNYISIKKAPYIVSLQQHGIGHLCGGSIIDEKFVLTAARCVDANQKYQVLVGTNNLNKGGKLYDVEEIFIHPKYSNKRFHNDISILKLNETLQFGSKVNLIHLDDKSIKLRKGMTLKVTGWGCTEPQGNITDHLHQMKVQIVLRKPCRQALGNDITLTRSMTCAGGNGRDACKGDDGGPLLWRNVQVGIVSVLLGKDGSPRVYTKVSEMIPWIRETIYDNIY